MGPGGQEEFVSGRYMGARSSGDCERSASILNATSSDNSDSATEGTPFPLPLAQSHRLRRSQKFLQNRRPGRSHKQEERRRMELQKVGGETHSPEPHQPH